MNLLIIDYLRFIKKVARKKKHFKIYMFLDCYFVFVLTIFWAFVRLCIYMNVDLKSESPKRIVDCFAEKVKIKHCSCLLPFINCIFSLFRYQLKIETF